MRRLVVPVFALLALTSNLPAHASEVQWNVAQVRAPQAWATATGAGVVVAVVDTGVDARQPELAGRLVGGVSWVGCGAAPRPCGAWGDQHGHGTHVAGIVAAASDGAGVVGVAPGALVMPVRVLDASGSGDSADVAAGIRWAADHGASVINLSLAGLPVVSNLAGATGLDGGFAAAMRYAADRGVLVVAAAGNESFPICDNDTFVAGRGLCVGALDRRRVRAWYSNFALGVDVWAPGGAGLFLCEEDVLSTYLVDATGCTGQRGYEAMSGTSMAAPHVAGIGALLGQRGITGARASACIRTTADLLGRVDAARAVTASC